MTIVGLYRDILGIRPQWNRLVLDPRMAQSLDGTFSPINCEVNFIDRHQESKTQPAQHPASRSQLRIHSASM